MRFSAHDTLHSLARVMRQRDCSIEIGGTVYHPRYELVCCDACGCGPSVHVWENNITGDRVCTSCAVIGIVGRIEVAS